MGYELITNPGLLLLDEPTSGLDSHTSLQIAKLIKEQANRGMAILTTIHSPSSEIFNIFDRIIILSDGYTFYNDKPGKASQYLLGLNIKFGKYVNPADWLIKLANDPQSINADLSLEILVDQYEKRYSHLTKIERATMFQTGLVS